MALIEGFNPAAGSGKDKPASASLPNTMNSAITTTPTVNDKYQVDWQRPLGMGAFGGVFEGIQRSNGKRVAIKQIPKNCTEYVTFQREMDALAAISKAGGHPNINTLRETFVGGRKERDNGAKMASLQQLDDDNNYYLVLDLVSGNEMFDQLCEKGAYSEARLVRQVASALAFLHDLAENLMLTSKDTNNAVVQVVDFGCAAHHRQKDSTGVASAKTEETRAKNASSTQLRMRASTPAYCPPEVLRTDQPCNEVLPTWDMWSLGVILFAMLTGTHPFDVDNDASDPELERRIVEGEMPSLDDASYAFLSDDVKALIAGLMAGDPKERWTASQVLMHPWVQGKTAKSRKIEQSDIKLMTFRRHKSAVIQKIFQTMLIQSASTESAKDKDTRTNISWNSWLLCSLSKLDQKHLGYISTKDIHGDARWYGADAKLSYSELSDVVSDTILNLFFPSGHELYREGQQGDLMFFLNSGSVDVTSADGFVHRRGAGEFFGEEVAKTDSHNQAAYSTTAVCATPVHVFAVSRDCFEKYMKSDVQVALTMAELDRLRNRERSRAMLGLNKRMKDKNFGKNQILFEQGMKGSDLFIVKEGDVEILRDGFRVRTLAIGEMTGEHAAFYDKKPYNVTAVCKSEECKMGILKGKHMHALFKTNRTLEKSFREIIVRRDLKKAICAATRQPFPESEQQLRSLFDLLAQGKADYRSEAYALTLEDLRQIMLKFDATYTQQDLESLLESLDLNESGSISWDEFKAAYGMAKEA
ncbi:MAG: hypothetical protein SGILL_002554 [Bacillariaceae sp.]